MEERDQCQHKGSRRVSASMAVAPKRLGNAIAATTTATLKRSTTDLTIALGGHAAIAATATTATIDYIDLT